MTFTHSVQVRYGEVDMQGVVFNAHWLSYFDDAITHFFAHLGYPPQQTFSEVFDFMLVRAVIEWKEPAGYDDAIDIGVYPVRLGNTSFNVRFDARVGGRPACEATITYVLIEPGRNSPAAIPDELQARLMDKMDQSVAT